MVSAAVAFSMYCVHFRYFRFWNLFCITNPVGTYPIDRLSVAVWWIRIILIWIRIQDVKKKITDPDPGQTLIWIRIQVKMIRIQIQLKRTKYQENLKTWWKMVLTQVLRVLQLFGRSIFLFNRAWARLNLFLWKKVKFTMSFYFLKIYASLQISWHCPFKLKFTLD